MIRPLTLAFALTSLGLSTTTHANPVGPRQIATQGVAPGSVGKEDWDKLGEREVNGAADHDTVDLGPKAGEFTAIRLKIEVAAIKFKRVKVTFQNGESFEPKVPPVVGDDRWTKPIDLPGSTRTLKKVEFWYGNVPGVPWKKGRVELWGKR